jgi:hypothetical protein
MSKFYFSSIDTSRSREVIISADSCYVAMIRLWQRELELLRAIPAESIPLWDVGQMRFDPELVVHRGIAAESVEVPTAPILAAFLGEDRGLILGIMAENWAGEFDRFFEDTKFFN